MQVKQKEIESATFTGTKMEVIIQVAVTGAHYAFIHSVKRGFIGTARFETQDEAFAFARHITTAIQ